MQWAPSCSRPAWLLFLEEASQHYLRFQIPFQSKAGTTWCFQNPETFVANKKKEKEVKRVEERLPRRQSPVQESISSLTLLYHSLGCCSKNTAEGGKRATCTVETDPCRSCCQISFHLSWKAASWGCAFYTETSDELTWQDSLLQSYLICLLEHI